MTESPVETIPDYRDSLPVRASVETALSGNNNDVRAEWLVPGTGGNGKTLAGTFSASYDVPAVALVGSAPVTGIALTGPVDTTLNQILDAIRNTPAVAAVVHLETKVGNNGTGAMVTFSALNFAGGTGSPPASPVQTIP